MEALPRDEWSWSKLNDLGLQEFQALVVNYDDKTILLKREGERSVMPAYIGDIGNYESSYLPEFVKEKVEQEVQGSLDLCVLRQVWREEMEVVKEHVHRFFEKAVVLLEYHTSGDVSDFKKVNKKGYMWIPLEKAEVYHLFSDAQSVIEEEIKWIIRDRTPENRLRWQRPGWMRTTTSWMKEILRHKKGAHLLNRIKVERSTPLGTILIAETTKGKFFLKCTTPWQNDAAYTELLSRIIPEFVSSPVEVDVEKQVMITSDYGDILVPSMFDGVDQIRMTQDFVKLQREVMGRVQELCCAGMPDFRCEALLSNMDWVAGHKLMDAIAECAEYKNAVIFFRNNLEKLKKEVKELYATGIPATVNHNDLYFSNVYKRAGCKSFMFFDWVEAYIAHPLAGSLDGVNYDEYFRAWKEYGSEEQLERWLQDGGRVRMIITCILRMIEAERTEGIEAREAFERAAEEVNDIYKCSVKRI